MECRQLNQDLGEGRFCLGEICPTGLLYFFWIFSSPALLLGSPPPCRGLGRTGQEAADVLTALMWGLKCSCGRLAEEQASVSSVLTCLIRKAEEGNAINVSPSLTIGSLKLLTFLFCLVTLTALDIGLLWFLREGKEGRHGVKKVSSCLQCCYLNNSS